MTLPGILLVDAAGLLVLGWVLNMVRLGRLYVGYAALFVALVAGLIADVSVPPLNRLVAAGVERVFPGGSALVLPFGLVLVLLAYILSQVSILANRLSALVQDLAVEEARAPRADAAGGAPAEPTARR